MAFSVNEVMMKTATINQWRDYAHQVSKEKGWWDGESFNIGEKLMLSVGELSEAMEDVRSGKMEMYFEADGKPCGFPTEIGDNFLRLLDLCGKLNIDIGEVMLRKAAYNETRPYRHGGKAA